MVENKIKEYFTNKADIAAVYLFGSYANGHAHPGSDVDLAILFGNRDRDIVNQRLEEIQIQLSRKLRIDLHLTALNFAGEVLLKQILKKGHCLIVNDSRIFIYFTMNALTRIVDFQFYLEKMQSAMTRRVLRGL